MKTEAIDLINEIHDQDPKIENGESAERLYSDRMVKWLYRLNSEATELDELAARCQHLQRWGINRETYPMNKVGYHQWRTALYNYQANLAGVVLNKAGYNTEEINIVKELVSKKNLRTSEGAQLIEDTACLVFLSYYFKPFYKNKDYSEEKWINIVKKTWNKMSDKAQKLSLEISFDNDHLKLIKRAIS
ncbi:MAG: hypothetical protein ACJAZ2_000004 [Glaciecola sp.]|jgi:hypothetical protein